MNARNATGTAAAVADNDAPRAATAAGRRPTVMLACLNGFSVRYLLRSDVLRGLKEAGAQCVVLFGGADDPAFIREFADDQVVVRKLRNEAYRDYEKRRPWLRFLKNIKRFSLNGRYDTATLDNSFNVYARTARGLAQHLYVALQRVCIAALRRAGWLRRAIVAAECRWAAPAIHDDVFREFRPDVLVVTTLGYLDYDNYLMREARRHGARIVSVILSWDNPSSKGVGGAWADHVITWTDVMKKEIVEYHDYPPARVSVGGVAHFDDYARPERLLSRDEFLREFDLDPDRRTIFFAAKTPSHYPWNPEIIEIIAQAIEAGRFSRPCQIVARLHPAQFVKKHAVIGAGHAVQDLNQEAYAQLRERYRHLRFSVPKIRVGQAFDIDNRERTILASLLAHGDVVVNFLSTVNLEAAIFDRPIVNVGFNGGPSPTNNPRHDLSIDEAQVHNRRVLATGAIRLVRNPEELLAAIEAYLVDPSQDRDARRRLVANECGGHLGTAGMRIAREILAQAHA